MKVVVVLCAGLAAVPLLLVAQPGRSGSAGPSCTEPIPPRSGKPVVLAELLLREGVPAQRVPRSTHSTVATGDTRPLVAQDSNGRPIPDIRIVRVDPTVLGVRSGSHPGPLRCLESWWEAGSSPDGPPASYSDRGDLWIGAKGLAWQPLLARGDAPFVFAPAAELELTFRGSPPVEPMALIVRRSDTGTTVFSLEAPDWNALRIDGLEVGSYELCVVPLAGSRERGDRWNVELVPGQRAQLDVVLPLGPDATARVPLRGSLVLAEHDLTADIVERLRLEVFPLGVNGKPDAHLAASLRRDQLVDLGYEGAWSFETEPLPLGKYVVEVDPIGHLQDAQVEPLGGWVDVIVPLLARTVVTVRAPDGAVLSVPRVRAHLLDSAPQERLLGPMVLDFLRADAPDVQVVSVPGTLLLETGLDEWRPSSSTVEVVAGWNTVELRVALVHPLRLFTVAGEGAVALPLEWWLAVEVESLDGGEVLDLRLGGGETGGPSQAILGVSDAGRYRLRFPSLPGAAVHPRPRVVRVGADANEDFRIDVREGNETQPADEDSSR